MKTILKIAWRNLWRNKLRTSVIIFSIILGLWGSMFFMGMMNGMNENRISSAINTYLAHIQIHNSKYLDNPIINNNIKDVDKIVSFLQKDKRIKAFSKRSIIDAMASTSKGSTGIKLIGIDKNNEVKVSSIPTKLSEGSYLSKYKKPSVVIGKKLADKLGLKLKSKIKLSFQNLSGDVLSYAFRVEGIYKLNNSMIERSNVFIKKSDLNKLLNLSQDITHEILIKLNDIKQSEAVKKDLQAITSADTVQTWDEVAPELGYAQETMSTFAYIFMAIILVALSFAIINTMLMAVLERKRELGIMMAVGFNKTKLFLMIMTETLLIALIAAPLGLLISYATIHYFEQHGLHFLSVAQGMEYFGVGATIYTKLEPEYYWVILLMTLFTAFLSAVFPARKALNTKPIEAIREI